MDAHRRSTMRNVLLQDFVFHLLVLVVGVWGVFSWFAPSDLPLWARVTVSIVAGGLFLTAVIALQEMVRRRRLVASLKRPVLHDGHAHALVGRLAPIDQPVKAPLANADCVAASYRIYTTAARGGRSIVFEGYALAPCVLKTVLGDLPLANYPAGGLRQTFLVDRLAHPSAFEAADRLMATPRTEDAGEWPLVRRHDGGPFSLVDELPSDRIMTAHRRVGPIDARAVFLAESYLPADEELCLFGVWSENSRALVSESYAPRTMRIIAWGSLDAALRVVRREAAWKAIKAVLAAAAGVFVLWVVSSRLEDIKRVIDTVVDR